jgi:nicotinamidase-related amidase
MPEADDLPHVQSTEVIEFLPPKSTALIVVDIQNDFAAPNGIVAQAGADMSSIPAAIEAVERLVIAARQAGATVAFMRVVTREESDSAALRTFMRRRGTPGGEAICRAEGGGADYYRIFPEPGDIEIEKLLFDSFHGTELNELLKARGIDTVLMAGLSTDCCVDQTARSAFHHGYHVFVASDACAAYEPGLHRSTLNVLQKNCALLTTTEAVEAAWRV